MSGLSFLSKLVERIVAAEIRSHMDSHDLGNTFQSAYKLGHSTETALLCNKDEIHLPFVQGYAYSTGAARPVRGFRYY